MYRIRLVSGQEKTYPSIQDLTAGVQRGEVTAEAEIYHQRTERWLSIESHPHYRMAADGGTATRTSRLRFTRPTNPGSTPAVLPTPAAKQPDQGDLEELNKLLVLLEPLPTPTQQPEPVTPVVNAAPESLPARPEPSAVSDETGQTFGTMLRLEDLEPVAAQPEPLELEPPTLEVIRDTRLLTDEVEPVEAANQPVEPASSTIDEIAPSDLGLPVEIHLDEIPVPEEILETAPAAEFAADIEEMELVEVSPEPAPIPVAASFHADPVPAVRPLDAAVPTAPTGKRMRPMLIIGAAALIAAAIYGFTAGGSEPDQGMVTLASATPAPTVAAPASSMDSAPAPSSAATVGFPTSTREPVSPTSPKAAPVARDSAASASILPSAPTIDLAAGDAEQVSAGSTASGFDAARASALAKSYGRSYDALAADFSEQMDHSGMVRLFGQTQLTTSDGLAGARRALDVASAAVRKYHAREVAIEKAYQDSAKAMERSGATPSDLRDWMTHTSRKESQEATDEGARLTGQIDAVFALLQAQAGKYKVDGTTIRFENADAGTRYTELQSWINRRLEYWSGQPASSAPVTVRPILDGIGLTRLPLSR